MPDTEPLGAGDPVEPTAEPAPEPAAAPSPLRGSRTSGVWGAVVALGILLILLVIFIVQNTQKVEVSFLGWNGRTPLAAALLVATAAGLLVAAIAGSLRILQLRRRVKRSR
ncbi:conserved hypothetical protein [metagenome]|uniref:Lipopolysaccharide assembly protein A domain-containing protein n=1 Tax=metagenome TaxID=256318 RepID=A0A2P2CD54_9ZZZZ